MDATNIIAGLVFLIPFAIWLWRVAAHIREYKCVYCADLGEFGGCPVCGRHPL